jgi:Flp pilus assembly protein TadG
MTSKHIRFVRDNRGQSLVEFALILPMMLVVMFMITEFGRALYQYNVLSTAAREGARKAVVSSSSTAVANGTARMDSILTKAGIAAGTTVNIDIENNYQGSGENVVIATATRTFNWAFKGPMSVNANPGSATVSKTDLVLQGQSIMHAETF